MTATASQAWAILKRHARDEIATLRLQDLCQDNGRVSSLVCVHNSPTGQMLMIDLSRQRMTLETLNHLLKLSVTRGVRRYITRLAWGQNNPQSPLQVSRRQPPTNRGRRRAKNKQQQQRPITMPSMHLALRAPKNQGLHMITLDGVNALTASHREWDRLERLSESIRRGTCRGVSGQMLRDVVVVGSGVAIKALQFIAQALEYDETAITATKLGLDTSGNSWGGATSRLLQKNYGNRFHSDDNARVRFEQTPENPFFNDIGPPGGVQACGAIRCWINHGDNFCPEGKRRDRVGNTDHQDLVVAAAVLLLLVFFEFQTGR